MDIGNLISGSSAFSKCSLYIWKFLGPVLLKPILKDFEHYLVNMWSPVQVAKMLFTYIEACSHHQICAILLPRDTDEETQLMKH